jgi:putative PIN family toxin of toxin-antitoxin system
VRVIIDANVFVSAAIQRGASHRIVLAWLAGTADFEVVMCPELLGEVREVLTTRPRLRKWISLQNATLFVETIEAVVDLVEDPGEVKTETRDPNDSALLRRRTLTGISIQVQRSGIRWATGPSSDDLEVVPARQPPNSVSASSSSVTAVAARQS